MYQFYYKNVNVAVSALNDNDVLTSDILDFKDIEVLSVAILLLNIKSFCDFVYTSDILDFKAIAEFNVAILLFNVTVSDFKAIAVLRVL